MAKGTITFGKISQETADSMAGVIEQVAGEISYSGNDALTRIHLPRRIAGKVSVRNCPNLTTLCAAERRSGEDYALVIDGDLELDGCSKLTSFNIDGLRINGDLILYGCTNLNALPSESLHISGHVVFG